MSEPLYEVVSPVPQSDGGDDSFVDRVGLDLNGKTIAELCDMEMVTGWFPPVRAELQRRYPDLKILPLEEFGLTHGSKEHQVIEELPDRLRDADVDLVVSGLGT